MSVRELVAAQVRADHPGWDVRAYPYVPANVTAGRPVVAIWRPELAPGSTSLVLRHEVTVNLYGSKTAGEAVETELDGLLDGLMLSLQRLDRLAWVTASRTVWGQISGWQIAGYMEPNNTYASIVRTESESP